MKRQLRDFFKFAENLKKLQSTKPHISKNYLLVLLLSFSFVLQAQQPGFPFVNAGSDVVLDCETPCAELSATFFDTGETTSYEVVSIDYDPPFPFTGGTSVSVGSDDIWSQIIPLPFDFCFYGETYTNFLIGSNGVVTFDTVNNTPGGFCPFAFSASIPSPSLISASINGVYMDIDPSIGGSGIINYTFFGEAPARTLVVNFPNIPYFGSACQGLTLTSQIVFYETTNIIDVYVENRSSGCSWNSGNAVIGIQNVGGTQGITPPGRNTGDWSATNEAWRFIPNGNSNVEFAWLDESDVVIGTTPTIEVCPTLETTYTARATYTNCNGDVVIETDTVTVTPCEFSEPDCLRVDFLEDFGAGVGRFETPFTNYVFQPVGQVEDGQYVISNSTSGLNTGWFTDMTDHTGDPDGRMLVVNADFDPGEFYRRTVSLFPNIDYTFSAWITTVYNTDTNICPGGGIPSNVIFRIEDLDGNTIAEIETGDIPNSNAPNWQEYLIEFNSLDNDEIQIVLINNGEGGCGNDLAIDDISLTYSTDPPVIATPEDMTQCDVSGTTSTFDLTTQIPAILDGQDPAGFNISFHLSEADAETNTSPIALPDAYENTENPQTIFVRVENASQPTCFSIVLFDLIVEDGIDIETALPDTLAFCDNETTFPVLDATPTNAGIDLALVTYEWFLGGDLISQEATITPIESGIYTVIIVYDGCSELTVDVEVNIQEAPVLDLGPDETFCDGDSFEIVPFISGNSANTTYLWSTGETTPTIFVNTSNTYSLEITDGECVVTDSITINFGDLPTIELAETIFSCPGETQVITVFTNTENVTYAWFENGVLMPGETGTSITVVTPQNIGVTSVYYMVEVNDNGCISTAEVELRAYPSNPRCIISQGISPDGSIGSNDNLDLTFLVNRTGIANLQILNRHGRQVYSFDNYVNQWVGQADNGDPLPTGTYFYVISFAGTDAVYGTTKTGWIYVNRESN